MTPDPGAITALAIAGVGVVVWMIRLEGRVNGKADASTVAVIQEKTTALEAAAKASEHTKDEVIRLQEQIKHLTGLIERWLQPAPIRRRPRPTDSL